MKICISLFLLVTSLMGYSQQLNSVRFAELKQEILHSKEVTDWQNTMIAYQKSNSKFCALKYEQKLNQNLFSVCGKRSIDDSTENFILQLFRTMRIKNELKDSVVLKEKALRTKYPQLVTQFELDEIFAELYARIEEARKKY